MPGFIRRFSFYPGNEVITQIEGVVIVDLPPPGAVEGVATGVACLVGEFEDCTHAVTVDGTGAVTEDTVPQEIFSAQDLANKVGGWDETIGDFGDSGGNGFVSLRTKRFSRLVVTPVNMASGFGCRFFRELPLCTSQTDALPVVPVSGAVIDAGREFINATNGRIRLAGPVLFSALDTISSAIEGQCVAGAAAATQVFKSGGAATQVWQEDAAPPGFVDMTTEFNDAVAANLDPFPAASAAGDNHYVGRATTFDKITYNYAGGTAGTVGVVVWEYWNGAAWTALANVVDATAAFTTAVADNLAVTWTMPTDWAQNAVNSVTAFYVRARVTTLYTIQPVLDQAFIGGVDWAAIARPEGGQGAKIGDIIVIGQNNAGAKQPLAEANTYRVQATPAAGINLTVQSLSGANFAFTIQTSVSWRLHVSSDADSAPVVVVGATVSGGYAAATGGGCSVPVRPLTDEAGASTDGVWTINTTLAPLVVPAALTGSSADPLSGLAGFTHPVSTVDFDASIQGPNAAADSTIDALYTTALAATIADASPMNEINIIWAARTSSTIRSGLRQNCLEASSVGAGRVCCVRPELDVVTTSAAIADASPGVGATRNERVIYCWPGTVISVPEAVETRLPTADGLTTIDGLLDVGFDAFVASIMSNLPPEKNPGQPTAPIPAVLAAVLGIQRGVAALKLNDYIALRARGVAALRLDKTVGAIVQSGITSSLTSGEKNISRRRMADFIQDSISQRLVQLSKLLLTDSNKDNMVGEVDDFMAELLSLKNPAAQRIQSYSVDDKSGNTPESEAKGIFVIIVRARTIPSGDFIVLQTEVGNNVVTTTDLAA